MKQIQEKRKSGGILRSSKEKKFRWLRNILKFGVTLPLCFQVFFTRNGKIIGKKEVMLPKGGFYPTVGMMSSQEKVRVELKPLSG